MTLFELFLVAHLVLTSVSARADQGLFNPADPAQSDVVIRQITEERGVLFEKFIRAGCVSPDIAIRDLADRLLAARNPTTDNWIFRKKPWRPYIALLAPPSVPVI